MGTDLRIGNARRFSRPKLGLIMEIEDTVRSRVSPNAELPHLSELNTLELQLIRDALKGRAA